MTVNRLAAMAAAIMLAGAPVAPAMAGDINPPFASAPSDSPETLSIWKGFDDEYLTKKNPNLYVFTATVKTPEGANLTISQLNSPYVCGDVDCPIRIVRDGKLVFDDTACRYTEKFALNESMNTLFMCDRVVPTIQVPEK
jgi:hypothetical protein